MDYKRIEFIIFVLDILVGQNFTEVDSKLEIKGFFYLLTSSWVLEQADRDN